MTTTYVSEQLATDHAAALRRDAAAARLRGSRPVGASCCA